MKIPQIAVLSARECLGTHYSFSQYINEYLRGLCRRDGFSAVRVVSCDDRTCVVEYQVEVPMDEV